MFAPDSVFNQPIEERAGGRSKAPYSDDKVKQVSQAARQPMINPQVNDKWGIPAYASLPTDPEWTIQVDMKADYDIDINGKKVRAPAKMKAASSVGGDQNLWIDDGTYVWMLRLGLLSNGRPGYLDYSKRIIHASKGNRLESNGSGFRYHDDPPTCVPPINPAELASGAIKRIIPLDVRCLSGKPVGWYSQSKTIGHRCPPQTDAKMLSMGDILYSYKDPIMARSAWDLIDAGDAPIWAKSMSYALIFHGGLVGRNVGSDWATKFYNPLAAVALGQPNPYPAWGIPESMGFGTALKVLGILDALVVAVPQPRP